GGPADYTVHQVRVRHQPANCQDARPHRARHASRPRRRGDRMMRRRRFITLLGGAAAAWPVAARAQQASGMRHIGVLMHSRADDPEAQARLLAFLQGLSDAGWAVGRNLRIDYRWSVGTIGRLSRDAAELVALKPEIILAGVGGTTPMLLQATRTVPIVF